MAVSKLVQAPARPRSELQVASRFVLGWGVGSNAMAALNASKPPRHVDAHYLNYLLATIEPRR